MLLDFLNRASFFALVQYLDRRYNAAAKVGDLGPARYEHARFRANPALEFPRRDVAQVSEIRSTVNDPGRSYPQYAITANFLGLVGTVSPLPTFYTELILQSDNSEEAQRAFLDFFHHRLLSLFYRAGLKYRHLFAFQGDCSDATSRRMLALAGFAPEDSIRSTEFHPSVLLRYAGLLYHRPHSASVIQTALTDYLGGLRVRVKQCAATWIGIDGEQRTLLGHRNSELGGGCLVGSQIRTCGSSFQIILGPMHYDRFVEFLPSEKQFSDLVRFVGLFLRDRLDFSIEVRVYRRGIPLMFASSTATQMGARLGWTSWLTSREIQTQDDDWQSVTFEGKPGRIAA